MKIIAYRKHSDIDVEFLDEYHYVKRNNTYHNFKLGQIKNPYDRALFGVGFIGDGKWKVKDENGKFSRVYLCWMHMIERCYYEKNKDLHPSYFGLATVCPEWHNFQVFADWYKEREYDVNLNKKYVIDSSTISFNFLRISFLAVLDISGKFV